MCRGGVAGNEQLVNAGLEDDGLPGACHNQSVSVNGSAHHARGSVLVVDDEPTIAEVVARYLERAGYETRVAGDGPQALELAARAAARTSSCST